MSLISDALRKARQEAAERAASDRDGLVPPVVLEAQGRFGAGVVVGAVVAVAASLAGAGVVWLTLARPPRTSVTADPATPTAVAAATPSQVGAAPPATVPPLPTTTAAAVAPVATAMMAATPVAPVPTADPFALDTGAAPSPTPPPRPTATSGPRDFVAEADLGYATLRLDLVVFRADDPWAQVNGRDVRVGTHVDGFVVEAIERDRVLLRDQRGPLVLRVR